MYFFFGKKKLDRILGTEEEEEEKRRTDYCLWIAASVLLSLIKSKIPLPKIAQSMNNPDLL